MRFRQSLWAAVVLTLIAASCSSSSDPAPSSGQDVALSPTSLPENLSTTMAEALVLGVPVGEGDDAVVDGSHGSVLVPSSSVSGPGSLVVETAVALAPPNLDLVGEVFDVSLICAFLVGTAVFTTKPPRRPAGFPDDLPTVWLATLDDATGEWTPIETRLVDGLATAEVDHFTKFGWMRPDLDWLGDMFNGLVMSVFGPGVFDVEHPKCGDQQLASLDGLEVTSDSGSSTFWCVGVEDGRTVIKIANNRRYSVGMNLPDKFTLIRRERSSGVVEALNPVADPAFGFDATISRGEEVVIGVPDGGVGRIVVKPSPGTFLLDTLSIEIDFVASILKVDGAVAAAALSGKCFVDNVPDMFGDDLQSGISAAFSSGFGCMSDALAETVVDGWLAKMLWGFASSTIRLVIEGLSGSASGIVDSIRGILDGSDFYNIEIANIVPTPEPVTPSVCEQGSLVQAGYIAGNQVGGWTVKYPENESFCLGEWGLVVWYPAGGSNPLWTVIGVTNGRWRTVETLNVFVDQPSLGEEEVWEYVASRIEAAGAPSDFASAIVSSWPRDDEHEG